MLNLKQQADGDGRPRTGTSPPAEQPAQSETRICATRSLQDQMDRAAKVQRSLLPDVTVPIGQFRLASFYCPCETLGGDFYDLTGGQDCAVLLVADVMGHGVEAALITMMAKAVFQEAAEGTDEPCELLQEMNSRLHRLLPSRVFVAATVARLCMNGSRVRLANAGLPYPFILRGSQRLVEEVELTGLPLGLFDGCGNDSFNTCTLKLGTDDVLLISSDGIGSIRATDGEYFQDGRLRQVLKASTGREGVEVIADLMVEACNFGWGRPIPDDINLVAISRNGHG